MTQQCGYEQNDELDRYRYDEFVFVLFVYVIFNQVEYDHACEGDYQRCIVYLIQAREKFDQTLAIKN